MTTEPNEINISEIVSEDHGHESSLARYCQDLCANLFAIQENEVNFVFEGKALVISMQRIGRPGSRTAQPLVYP